MSSLDETQKAAALEQSAALMNCTNGFDVVIICTNTDKMAQFWQTRLEASRGTVIPSSAVVLSVFEDWPGGAGNAFGTMYAWKKACAQALEKGFDLNKQLADNQVSCAIFHTAGKGTRLAPLPGSENNNKPGVKLPAVIDGSNGEKAITILEAVIQQTGIYASSRKGRLSVFWGDQVFIPSVSPVYTPQHHADILCTLGPMPDAETWTAKGLDKYGLIAVGAASNEAAQVEKVSHETALRLLSSLGEVSSVGASLGSFSVSAFMLTCFMQEFDAEISSKNGKLDTDPGLWMPLTLSKDAYVEIMSQKGMTAEESTAHFDRMQKVKANLTTGAGAEMKLFGAVDVGSDAYWWDYGQLKLYQLNNMKLIEKNHEAATMRAFFKFNADSNIKDSNLDAEKVKVCDASCVSGSNVKAGNITGSLLCRVNCNEVECQDAILVNVSATKIKVAPGCVVYNVCSNDPEGIVLTEPGSVLMSTLTTAASTSSTTTTAAAAAVDTGVEGVRCISIKSNMDLDGGVVWKEKVLGNEFSFEEIYLGNGDADVTEMDKIGTAMHNSTIAKINA